MQQDILPVVVLVVIIVAAGARAWALFGHLGCEAVRRSMTASRRPGAQDAGPRPFADPPYDLDSRVRVPRPVRPFGRLAAAAVEEPDEYECATAVAGGQHTRR